MTVRINIISGPRNVSTALLYSFRQRPDTTVVDEPLYGHWLRLTGAEHPGAEEVLASMPTDGAAVVRRILGVWPTGEVAFKQMAHHLVGVDLGFLDACRNLLLVREPAEVLASYTKKVASPTLAMLGYPTQLELLDRAAAAGTPLVVIDARRLLEDPARILAEACSRLGLAFTEAMLSWPAGPKPEDGVWAEHWYAGVHRSTGFGDPPPARSRDEVEDVHRHLVDEATPLYERLHAHALR